jgi:hypothetical protein
MSANRRRESHPLDDAFARIDRAGEHLAELDRRISEFSEAQQQAILDRIDPDAQIPAFGIASRPSAPRHTVGQHRFLSPAGGAELPPQHPDRSKMAVRARCLSGFDSSGQQV